MAYIIIGVAALFVVYAVGTARYARYWIRRAGDDAEFFVCQAAYLTDALQREVAFHNRTKASLGVYQRAIATHKQECSDVPHPRDADRQLWEIAYVPRN